MNTFNETSIKNNDSDIFYINFLQAKEKLLKCHVDKNISSCFKCPSLFSCDIREEYVKATFENMNKGQEGTFDFN